MPRRSRLGAPVRRIHGEADYRLWSLYLTSGHVYFDEFSDHGYAVDALGRPSLELARAAWDRHGSRIMAEDPEDVWGLAEFGMPED